MSVNQALTPLFNKKRELETMLAGLSSRVEISEREAKTSAEAATELQDRITTLNALISDLEKIAEEAITTANDTLNGASVALQKANEILNGSTVFLQNLEKKVVILKKEALLAKKEKEDRLSEIIHENTLLDVRKTDLDIYFKRLQKRYQEEGLGELLLTD